MLWGAAAAETSRAALPTPKPDAGTLGSIILSVHRASTTCTTHQVVSKPCKQHFSLAIRAPGRRLFEVHCFKVGCHDARGCKRVLGPELASWERRKPIYLKETKTTKKVFSFKMYICN